MFTDKARIESSPVRLWSKSYNRFVHASEKGFILVLALVMLLVVSLLGMYALTTSTFEIQIAGNEKGIQEQFFQADSAVNELLARQVKPNHPNELAFYPASPPSMATCSDVKGKRILRTYDPDNRTDNGNVNLYFLRQFHPGGVSNGPTIIEVLACANKGNTVGSVKAGIQLGLPPGGLLSGVGYNQ